MTNLLSFKEKTRFMSVLLYINRLLILLLLFLDGAEILHRYPVRFSNGGEEGKGAEKTI